MELKVRFIESALSWATSFNRTFMELKEYNCAFKFRPVFKFQSHLYGIERTKWNDWSPPARVSIAPLWNWKYMPCTIKFRAHMFQSHLYGIESFHFFASSIAPTVSIAPLWNWKPGHQPPRTPGTSFNRTFMELKVAGASVIGSGIRFQSHLYGIESNVKKLMR